MPIILCVFAVNTETKEAELLTNLQPEDATLKLLMDILRARAFRSDVEKEIQRRGSENKPGSNP